MALRVVSPPTAEPVTLDELRLHLRLEGAEADSEGPILSRAIRAAREDVESFTRRALMTQTLEYRIDAFPRRGTYDRGAAEDLPQADRDRDMYYGEVIELPRAPVQSIAAVEYLDEDDVLQTIPASDYVLDADSEPARVFPIPDATWPATSPRPDAVRVRFVAGYPSAADVPARASLAVLMLAGHWYENREATGEGSGVLPLGVDRLLRSARWSLYA